MQLQMYESKLNPDVSDILQVFEVDDIFVF